jgi:hypothetical protein
MVEHFIEGLSLAFIRFVRTARKKKRQPLIGPPISKRAFSPSISCFALCQLQHGTKNKSAGQKNN